MFNFGRHKVTQGLMALGLTDEDWSGWYRLFSRGRSAEPQVARIFFRVPVSHTSPDEPFVVGVDRVQVPRSSLKLAGTSWLKAPRTPVFKVDIHRAQRFVHGAWLTPLEAGYSRAIPLRFLPAFPPKAKPAPVVPQRKPPWHPRKPAFYLVSAQHTQGTWQVPLRIDILLAWLWQRWELEVAPREMKSSFDVAKNNVGIPTPPSPRCNGVCGSMPSCY